MSTFRVKRTGKSKRSLRGPEEEREYGTSSSGLLCDRDINVRRDSIIGKSLATRASVMRQRNQAYLISYANVPAMSLYDIVEEQIKADNKKDLLHRMVLITDIDSSKRRKLGAQYEELFRQIESRFQSEPVTGLLLLYPKNCVHIIETSMKNLIETVKVFQRQADKGTVLTKCKIIVLVKNITSRLYSWWHYAVVSLEEEDLTQYNIGANPHRQINEMLVQLLRLGLFLSSYGKGFKDIIHKLSLVVPRYVPEQGLVYHLLETNEAYVYLPSDFLKKYKHPYDVHLASEMVWPLESHAFPVDYRMEVEKPKRVALSPMPSMYLMNTNAVSSQMAFGKFRDRKSALFPVITLTSSN